MNVWEYMHMRCEMHDRKHDRGEAWRKTYGSHTDLETRGCIHLKRRKEKQDEDLPATLEAANASNINVNTTLKNSKGHSRNHLKNQISEFLLLSHLTSSLHTVSMENNTLKIFDNVRFREKLETRL